MTANRTCCCTISWTFQKTPLDESAAWRRRVLGEVAEAGFAGVEMGTRVDAVGGVAAVKELLAETGLELVRINAAGEPREQLGQLAELGVPFHMTGAGKREAEGAPPERLRAVAAELEERAKMSWQEFGLPLGLHNHLWTLAENRHEVDRLLEAAPHLQLVLDIAHLQAGGGDPIHAIEDYRERICHVHLKDAAPEIFTHGPGGFRALGEGGIHVDVAGCVRALEQIGYDGWLGVELDVTESPRDDNARSRAFLREMGY